MFLLLPFITFATLPDHDDLTFLVKELKKTGSEVVIEVKDLLSKRPALKFDNLLNKFHQLDDKVRHHYVHAISDENTESYRPFTPLTPKQISDDSEAGYTEKCYTLWVGKDGTYYRLPRGFNRPVNASKDSIYVDLCISFDGSKLVKEDLSKILYFFHGVGGDASDWNSKSAMASLRQEARKIIPQNKFYPTASVSLGKTVAFMSGKTGEEFKEFVMPAVEHTLKVLAGLDKTDNPFEKRYLLGISLGGANATYMRNNFPKLFSKVALICPALALNRHIEGEMASKGPKGFFDILFESECERDYRLRTGADYWAGVFARALSPDELWQNKSKEKSSPFISLLKRSEALLEESLHVQTSSHDEYGFHEGGRLYSLLSKLKGDAIDFVDYNGKHCVVDPKKLAEFFSNN